MRGTALLIATLLAPVAFGQEAPDKIVKRQAGPMSALERIVGQWDFDRNGNRLVAFAELG